MQSPCCDLDETFGNQRHLRPRPTVVDDSVVYSCSSSFERDATPSVLANSVVFSCSGSGERDASPSILADSVVVDIEPAIYEQLIFIDNDPETSAKAKPSDDLLQSILAYRLPYLHVVSSKKVGNKVFFTCPACNSNFNKDHVINEIDSMFIEFNDSINNEKENCINEINNKFILDEINNLITETKKNAIILKRVILINLMK